MGYRVRLLYFRDQIPALDSRGSLAGDRDVGGGAAVAESIRRVPQGYLIGWKNKLFFVPDTRIDCAEIVDEDVEVAPPPQLAVQTAAPVATQVQAAATSLIHEAPPPPPPPEPGSIAMDKFGRYYRVPFPEATKPAAPPAAAPPAEPTPEEPVHTMTRSPRRRASMSPRHETQAPTSLEAAVAADEPE